MFSLKYVACNILTNFAGETEMAIWASRIYLRWYRAFNTAAREPSDNGARPWNKYGDSLFPFVEIPISSRICTIVGANESGKSQLLSAVEKILKGQTKLGSVYSPYDICRYCGLLTATKELWPDLGLEFSFETPAEFISCLTELGFPGVERSERKLRVFINGGSTKKYARLFDVRGEPIGSLSKEDWQKRNNSLPAVHFVRSDLKFANQIHISQLLAQYNGKEVVAYEPVQLQNLASRIVNLNLSNIATEAKNKEGQPSPELDALRDIQKSIKDQTFGTGNGGLECILFRDILKIPESILKRIQALNSQESGYVEQIIEDMNHRLTESLDISEFWQQDEDFSVGIEYKAGFFYFFINDRTGAKYTFDERSGGLKYFLSYYIQTKAIRDSMTPQGSIIVMDEPDGFLSAAGQRNLLSVFELLAEPIKTEDTSKRCQVIYTTHSPFLINRNYPERISLVRKGDGGEGTQHVEMASTRQYEPVRSGLGIEAAETLFMGTENLIVEGVSEQRILVSAIQRFGDPTRIDDMLDLNKLTIVSASGVWDVPRLLRATKRSKEKRPVVAVLIDGDTDGGRVRDEIVEEDLISRDFVATLADAGLPTSEWCDQPKTLEDLVPPILIALAVEAFVKERWNKDNYEYLELLDKWNQDLKSPGPTRLVNLVKLAAGGMADTVETVGLKAGVYESLALLIGEGSESFDKQVEALDQLESVFRTICTCITKMLKQGRTKSRQDRLVKSVRLEVERFKKIHNNFASKADVRRCLRRLEVLPVGGDDKARQTRENIRVLQQILDDEVGHAGFPVNHKTWTLRLDQLIDCPWTDKDLTVTPVQQEATELAQHVRQAEVSDGN